MDEFKSLGKVDNTYRGLETFERPARLDRVVLTTDEVTALCPITKQPDWYTVTVDYAPDRKCVESKTFKLFMGSLRDQGMFCEALSQYILDAMVAVLEPHTMAVTVVQKPRGGVSISATSTYGVYER